jgi:hypothetical protein
MDPLFNLSGVGIMAMRPFFSCRQAVAGLALAAVVVGCAQTDPIRATSMVLTSGAMRTSGKRTPVHSFGHDDYIWQLVDFSWGNLDNTGGMHRCSFYWYRDSTLVSETPEKYCYFGHSPWTLETHRAAATLGTGHFRVETVVDGQIMVSSVFDITS